MSLVDAWLSMSLWRHAEKPESMHNLPLVLTHSRQWLYTTDYSNDHIQFAQTTLPKNCHRRGVFTA